MLLALLFLLVGLVVGGLCGAAIQDFFAHEALFVAERSSESRSADSYIQGVAYGRSHLPRPQMEAGAWD